MVFYLFVLELLGLIVKICIFLDFRFIELNYLEVGFRNLYFLNSFLVDF